MTRVRPSFMSEHTVEFYLVPRFMTILSSRFSSVLPFFFWSTREGNATSRRALMPESVRVCALFARRPKLGDGGKVLMKVNQELFDMARDLSEAGVPVFAGIPVVSSLLQLAQKFECDWYCLASSQGMFADCEIECESRANLAGAALRGPLRRDEVVDTVEDRAKPATWQAMLETLRSTRSRQDRYHFQFGPVYKPVYFMFW